MKAFPTDRMGLNHLRKNHNGSLKFLVFNVVHALGEAFVGVGPGQKLSIKIRDLG
jgi:hypothetical protein